MTTGPESGLASRYAEQMTRLAQAARRAGRPAEDVRLLAVSKFQPASAIRELYALGQRDFGENYVQELAEKAAELADLSELRWHLIGHLQSNKARAVAPLVETVQTVATPKLARELGRRVRERRPAERGPLGVLVEVNLAGEAQKGGVDPAALRPVLDAIEGEAGLHLLGLMAIPPAADDPEATRPYFERLAQLRLDWGGPARLPELSMGMSHDAHVAVAAGASWVRIGTALFGSRG